MEEDRYIHNFTLTGNSTQVKPLCGGSKQLVSQRKNWDNIMCMSIIYFTAYILVSKSLETGN